MCTEVGRASSGGSWEGWLWGLEGQGLTRAHAGTCKATKEIRKACERLRQTGEALEGSVWLPGCNPQESPRVLPSLVGRETWQELLILGAGSQIVLIFPATPEALDFSDTM